MKKFFAMASVLAAMAVMGSAAPTCVSIVSINVMNIGGLGCTAGGLTFSNFQVAAASGGTGVTEIDLTGVSIVGGDVTLNFNPNLGINTEGGTNTDTHFAFTVTGPLFGADANTGGTLAQINETVCSMAQPESILGGCNNANVLFRNLTHTGESADCVGNTGSGTTTVCNFGNGVNALWVFKDISINNPQTGDLTSFNQSFLTSAVPEPMTLSMMGVGLLGLGLIARRRKQS